MKFRRDLNNVSSVGSKFWLSSFGLVVETRLMEVMLLWL